MLVRSGEYRTRMPDDVLPPYSASSGAAAHAGAASMPPLPRLAMLVSEMAAGRQEALAQLYDETSSMLNGVLHRMLEYGEDAEEVLLDVYMKAWKNASGYSLKRGSVQAWLIIMARNAAIDRIRQHRAHPRPLSLEVETGLDAEAPDASPEVVAAMAQRRRQVRRVLAELPPEQRDAVMLAFFGGLTHAELAERLGEPLGTVKSRIRMGLIRLRTLLEEGDLL
jgi:RNA polymerase sigma-70 factor (ECF subfamily)